MKKTGLLISLLIIASLAIGQVNADTKNLLKLLGNNFEAKSIEVGICKTFHLSFIFKIDKYGNVMSVESLDNDDDVYKEMQRFTMIAKNKWKAKSLRSKTLLIPFKISYYSDSRGCSDTKVYVWNVWDKKKSISNVSTVILLPEMEVSYSMDIRK